MRPFSWLVEFDPADISYDKFEKARMAKARCKVCNSCWVYLEGRKGPVIVNGEEHVTCFHGGPYYDYEKIGEL